MSTFKQLYQGSPFVGPVPVIGTPIQLTTGGSIVQSTTRFYRVSALFGSAGEGPASPEFPVAINASGTSTNQVQLPIALPPGATGERIYEGATGAETKLVADQGLVAFFTDTGAANVGGALPAQPAEVTATPGLGYTPSAGKTAMVLGIVASNPTPYTGYLFLSVVQSGNTGGPATRIVSGVPVPPDASGAQPVDITRKHIILPGGFLTGYVTAPNVILTIDGVEF